MTDPILTLPESLRDAFAEPLGPVTTDVDALLAAAEKTCTQHGQAGGRPRMVAVATSSRITFARPGRSRTLP